MSSRGSLRFIFLNDVVGITNFKKQWKAKQSARLGTESLKSLVKKELMENELHISL